jgi:glycosyltransferase involved in cell wall biosynthesis
MRSVTILIPVLDRPENAARVVDSIRSTSVGRPVEILFLASPFDGNELHACMMTGENVEVVTWEAGPGDYARKINYGLFMSTTPWIFTGADDLTFTPGWYEAFEEMASAGVTVIGTYDDANPTVKRGRHSTHTFVERRYIEEVGATFTDGPGVVLHEGYEHQWVDTELVAAAMRRKRWGFAYDCVIRHHHPFFDKTVEMDDTYRKALGGASHDSRLYARRRRGNA